MVPPHIWFTQKPSLQVQTYPSSITGAPGMPYYHFGYPLIDPFSTVFDTSFHQSLALYQQIYVPTTSNRRFDSCYYNINFYDDLSKK